MAYRLDGGAWLGYARPNNCLVFARLYRRKHVFNFNSTSEGMPLY